MWTLVNLPPLEIPLCVFRNHASPKCLCGMITFFLGDAPIAWKHIEDSMSDSATDALASVFSQDEEFCTRVRDRVVGRCDSSNLLF